MRQDLSAKLNITEDTACNTHSYGFNNSPNFVSHADIKPQMILVQDVILRDESAYNQYNYDRANSNRFSDIPERENSLPFGDQERLGSQHYVPNEKKSGTYKPTGDTKLCWCITLTITIVCSILMVAGFVTIVAVFIPICGETLSWQIAAITGIVLPTV